MLVFIINFLPFSKTPISKNAKFSEICKKYFENKRNKYIIYVLVAAKQWLGVLQEYCLLSYDHHFLLLHHLLVASDSLKSLSVSVFEPDVRMIQYVSCLVRGLKLRNNLITTSCFVLGHTRPLNISISAIIISLRKI